MPHTFAVEAGRSWPERKVEITQLSKMTAGAALQDIICYL
jgi:hypothetical protein